MLVVLSPIGDAAHLRAELHRQFPDTRWQEPDLAPAADASSAPGTDPGAAPRGVATFRPAHAGAQRPAEPPVHRERAPGLFVLPTDPEPDMLRVPLVFARQLLPWATAEAAASVNAWSQRLAERLLAGLPDAAPWRLLIAPHYGAAHAGRHRAELIRQTTLDLLRRRRRHLLRHLATTTDPFTPEDSLGQLLLTSPETGFLSLAPAPRPFQLRGRLSPFPKGDLPVASDKSAPCRAFAKLLEAEQRLGRRIDASDSCVDLGASPGSWTYVALARGARVTAVDRAPLREDLHAHPRLHFHRGDAFGFIPSRPVDWLLCDVIAAPERTLELLHHWLERRLCRQFIVTIKFKGTDDYPRLDDLKGTLAANCDDFLLTRLCANKNEACAAGILRP